MNDPELKAMGAVYDALQGLDAATRKRVADWVLAKLGADAKPAKAGAKRGRKPGKKAAGAKRGRKPAAVKATTAKKAGKRGRPKGSVNKGPKAKKAAKKASGRGPGRPKKSETVNA